MKPTLEPGTRVELIAMPHDPDPVPIGTRGTVTGSCEAHGYLAAQIWVDWDSGQQLALIEGTDRYRVIDPTEEDPLTLFIDNLRHLRAQIGAPPALRRRIERLFREEE